MLILDIKVGDPVHWWVKRSLSDEFDRKFCIDAHCIYTYVRMVNTSTSTSKGDVIV